MVKSLLLNNNSLQQFINKESFEPASIHDFPLAQVLNYIHDGVVVVNEKGVIVYANPSYTRILRVPVEKVIGRKMKSLEPDARILTVLETGIPILQEPVYLDHLNAEVIVDATPLYGNGKIIGGVTVFKQVGEVIGYYNALTKLSMLKKREQQENNDLSELKDPFKRIIGSDPVFMDSLNKASTVAASNASILLRGESGVGKEVFAKAIHESSPRKNGPFIKINCSAIPESLIESELFGYENGAFTGAKKGGKPGKFELADGGTIFLDEIGDMPINVQAKLLRVLQEREIERVGGSETISVDIRVIAATHQNLPEMIKKKQFREDLYYRINVVPIHIPALRERPQDIELLANHFTEKFSSMYNRKCILSKNMIERLKDYHWPGNVRQLINIVEHGFILCDGAVIQIEHLPQELIQYKSNNVSQYVEEIEQEQVHDHAGEYPDERAKFIAALKKVQYNRTKAMDLLGVSRRTFYKKLRQFNINLK
jgi:transcriptional regulator with PAS, ATPase and Fis domain